MLNTLVVVVVYRGSKMEVSLIEMPHDEAKKQVTALKEVFRRNKKIKQNAIYTDMRRVYGHMQHGGKVLDIYQVFKNCELNEDGDPKLAICRADAKKVYLGKGENGIGIFSYKPMSRYRPEVRKSYKDLLLPEGTFEWTNRHGEKATRYHEIKNRSVSTIVPLVPAPILIDEVKRSLGAYHILWEVEKWVPEPPVDPILLKKLTPNIFGVLATWNLTELERAIIKAHIVRE